MLKKTITFQDLDGNEITEDFYFNLSKAEIAEMELSHDGGFQAHLMRLVKSESGGEIIAAFKKIIMDSIGRRSEDGKRFVKSEEISQEFLQTDAYSVLFMELVTNENAAAEFVTGMIPKDLADAVATAEGATPVALPEAKDDETEKDERPLYMQENRDPTPQELRNMSKQELQEAFMYKSVAK